MNYFSNWWTFVESFHMYSKENICMICRCGAWSRGASGSPIPRRPWRPARPPITTMRRSPGSWRERTRSCRRSFRRSARPFFLTRFLFLSYPSYLVCKSIRIQISAMKAACKEDVVFKSFQKFHNTNKKKVDFSRAFSLISQPPWADVVCSVVITSIHTYSI